VWFERKKGKKKKKKKKPTGTVYSASIPCGALLPNYYVHSIPVQHPCWDL
jgi:hypothetical protein